MRDSIVVALALACSVPAVAGSADYEIQASRNAPAHPVGQALAKGAKISLPEGASIRFIDRTREGAAVTRECGGKYDGPIERCRPSPRGVLATTPGGTRGPRK